MNALLNREVEFLSLGLIDFQEAWNYQTKLFESIVAVKSANRSLPDKSQQPTKNYLIFCEHPHVYTLGKSGKEKNLLIPKEELHTIGATYYHINRGGDITYHGPGQIVGYPIFDLENFYTDIHQYLRMLEEAVIQTLAEFNIDGGRIDGLTGVWIDFDNPDKARKICAFGVKTSRWVTMHGLALNVNSNLEYFDHIIACNIEDKGVTSMEKELGTTQNKTDVERILKNKLVKLFEMTLADSLSI